MWLNVAEGFHRLLMRPILVETTLEERLGRLENLGSVARELQGGAIVAQWSSSGPTLANIQF